MKSRWPRRIVLGIGSTLLLALVSMVASEYYARWSARRELDEEIAQLDAKEPRWRLQDIEADRATIADGENSAQVVLAAHALLPAKWNVPNLDVLEKTPPPRKLSEDQAKKLAELLNSAPAALRKARELNSLPHGRYRIEYTPDFLRTLIGGSQKSRDIARLLELDIYHGIISNDLTQAWQSHRALLNTGRSVGDEPILVTMLVRMAIDVIAVQSLERALAQIELPKECLEERRKAFDEELSVPHFLIGIRGERAGNDHLCTNLETGKLSLLQTLKNFGGSRKDEELSWWEQANDFFTGSIVLNSHITMLHFGTAMVEAARLPLEQRYAAIRQIGESIKTQIKPDDRRQILARLLLPAVGKVAQAEQRIHSQLACAVAAMAVERFRLEKGRWPASLEEVMIEVPLDRYDGKPLRFRRTDDGVVIYSIGIYYGPNKGLYDGTGLDDLDKFDPGASRVEFRLWNPDRRALAAVLKRK
jgi:hypothetical protein